MHSSIHNREMCFYPYIFWYVYMIWYGYALYCSVLMGCVRPKGLVYIRSIAFVKWQSHSPACIAQCDSMRQRMLANPPRRTYTMNDSLSDIIGCAVMTVLFVALVALCWDYWYKIFSLYIQNLNQNARRNACHICLKVWNSFENSINIYTIHHALSPQSPTSWDSHRPRVLPQQVSAQ